MIFKLIHVIKRFVDQTALVKMADNIWQIRGVFKDD